jgi:hypothetical protein
MIEQFTLSLKALRLRAPVFAAIILAFSGCSPDALDPEATPPTDVAAQPAPVDLALTESTFSAYRSGIAIGTGSQPNSLYGARYNGALRIIGPDHLLSDLSAIKSRGGRVVVNLAGGQRRFRDKDGHFSFTLWKNSVDRFRRINFSSYIKDGTIIAHYLIDEPNDPTNWSGRVVSQATVEAMAKYSKQIWPGMSTVVRAYPDYMAKYSGTYYYLDAAWAQYVYRKGPINDFLSQNVSLAKKKGLALVVGLNLLKGGPNRTKMTASQVKSWGATLLGSSYPCAFVSYMYNSTYLSTSGIKDAMDYLRNKAQNRTTKSCRGS